jgi:hypothetical protein
MIFINFACRHALYASVVRNNDFFDEETATHYFWTYMVKHVGFGTRQDNF